MPDIILITRIQASSALCFKLAANTRMSQLLAQASKQNLQVKTSTDFLKRGDTAYCSYPGLGPKFTTEIIELEEPRYLVHRLDHGFFREYIHQQFFREENGYTLLKDIIEYKVPGGIFGRIYNALFLKNQIRSMHKAKNKLLANYAESAQWQTLPGFKLSVNGV